MNSLKLRALPIQGLPRGAVHAVSLAPHRFLMWITLTAIIVIVCASETLSSDSLALIGSSTQIVHVDIPGM